MIKNTNTIPLFSFSKFFERYKVSTKDIESYIQLIEDGKEKTAMDLFIFKYIQTPAEIYEKNIIKYLEETEKGELDTQSKKNIIKSVAILSFGLSALLSDNFNSFIKKAFSPLLFLDKNITNRKVKSAILDSTLAQFDNLTANSLLNTQNYVLKNIRNMQKEMIVFNQQTIKGLDATELNKAVEVFRLSIKNKFPEYQKMKEGKLIVSSYSQTQGGFRHYKLDDYIEMSVRTTILNIDRTSTQIYILNKEKDKAERRKDGFTINVAEYILIDNRILKTGIEREICKKVLADKKYGVPLVALDSASAKILGIILLDDAIASGAFGVFCRHGIKPVTVAMRKKLEKIIIEKGGV